MIRLAFSAMLCIQVVLGLSGQEEFTKARFLQGDPANLLQDYIQYPVKAHDQEITGDVIYRCTVNEQGELTELKRIRPAHPLLNQAVQKQLSRIESGWNPTLVQGEVTAYTYLLVFRFRQYAETGPRSYGTRCQRYMDKEKWSKALEVSEDWLAVDPYSVQLWRCRAQILAALGKDDTPALAKAQGLEKDILINVHIQSSADQLIKSNGAVQRIRY